MRGKIWYKHSWIWERRKGWYGGPAPSAIMNDSRLTGEVGQLGTALAPSAVCSVYDLSAVPTELPSANLVCSKRVEVRMWSLVREQTVPARVDRRFPFVGSRTYGRYGPGDLHHDWVISTGRDTSFPGSHKSLGSSIYGLGTGTSSKCHV